MIEIGKADPGTPAVANKQKVLDAYVPVGATSIAVEDLSNLGHGQDILIERTVTKQWLKEMGSEQCLNFCDLAN